MINWRITRIIKPAKEAVIILARITDDNDWVYDMGVAHGTLNGVYESYFFYEDEISNVNKWDLWAYIEPPIKAKNLKKMMK